MHLRARREEKARRTDAADIRKAPGIETSMAQSTLAWEGARSYHQHLVRLPSQAALIARARLFRPVDVSTRPRTGRFAFWRRTDAMPSIVTSVTLLGDRRITILSSGG